MENEKTPALNKALKAFQSEVEGASKSAENPYYSSKYADLASIWKTIRKPLTDNGLSVTQEIGESKPVMLSNVNKNGEVTSITVMLISLTTTLRHESGESTSGTMSIPMTKADPQQAGSAITYARRYALSAILGIHQEDDDANSHVPDPALVKAQALADKEQAKADKITTELHTRIDKGLAYLADKKIDRFDVPTRIIESIDKHLGIRNDDLGVKAYTLCRNNTLMQSYVDSLVAKSKEVTAPTAGQFAHDKSELLIAIVRCNLTGEEKEDLQRLVNSAKTADDLEAVRKSLEGAK